MFKKTDARQSKLFAGLTGVAALALLTACSAEEPAEQAPADQEVEQQTEQADDAQQETAAPETETTDGDTADDDTGASAGNDDVFTVIDAVEAEYDGGFIVDIDAEDGRSYFEVDVVSGNELFELDVTADGNISVDDQESDDDKIQKAERATVTVTDALNDAFEQHPDSTLDQIELDDDDGTVKWEVDLDDANGAEIELDIPAA